MPGKECVTHHHACDCREAKVKRLVKAIRKLQRVKCHCEQECPCDNEEWAIVAMALKEWEGEFE